MKSRMDSSLWVVVSLAVILSGCREVRQPGPAREEELRAEAPEKVPAEIPEERPAQVPEEKPEEPKLASVRDLGVSRAPLEDPAKGLSEHALAFYGELGTIARAGKVEHPTASAARGEARAKGRAFGARKSMAAPPAARAGAVRASRARMRLGGGTAMAMKADAAKLGVTTGGMQDIGQARKIIKEARVPSPEMFAAEGLISEHDIPLEGMPSGVSDLYASASVAWARRYGRKSPEAIVQLGFGVDMDLEAFHRPALNLAVVVDVSGSMRGGKIEAARKALGKLLDRLDEKDRLAVVLFNNTAWVPLESDVLGAEALAVARTLVAEIRAGGGTSIESGLRLGYEQVAAHLNEGQRSPRVLLFTDAQPNVGATTAHGFLPMMQGASAKGIGLGAFGVGSDFGQNLAYEIFQVRGANYFYLEDEEKIAKVFDEEFDYMVTPAAYDVRVMLVPAEGAEVADVLGVPDYEKGAEGVQLRIPSLFFSKRQGGGATLVAMKLDGPDFARETDVALVDLSFLPVGESEKVRQRIEVFLPRRLEEPYYSQPGAKKALLLADAVAALKAACRGQRAPRPEEAGWTIGGPRKVLRRGDLEITLSADEARRAAEGLGAFADWFCSQLGDLPELEVELRLIEKLEETLRRRAGLEPRKAPREIPKEPAPETSPPELEVF